MTFELLEASYPLLRTLVSDPKDLTVKRIPHLLFSSILCTNILSIRVALVFVILAGLMIMGKVMKKNICNEVMNI